MPHLTLHAIRSAELRDRAYILSDGEGLGLQVLPDGSKRWRFRYQFGGREKMISLGLYPDVPLEIARRLKYEARQAVRGGMDPSAQRKARKGAEAQTFEVIARHWLAHLARRVEQGKVAPATVKRTTWMLEKHLLPDLGKRPISAIQPHELLVLLKRMELRGLRNTPRRAKQKCGQLFRYAAGIGAAVRDISSDLNGLLERSPTIHHAGITDPRRLGELLRSIDRHDSNPVVAIALKLAPLVFLRPIELRTAEWFHIDLEAAEWRTPADRMKMRVPHLVPLSRQAIRLLRAARALSPQSRYVFPARDQSKPMRAGALNGALRRLGYDSDEMTPHGFRTTAATLLNELGFGTDIVERQLSHAIPGRIRRVYNHAQYLPERRAMMQRWADYLDFLRSTGRANRGSMKGNGGGNVGVAAKGEGGSGRKVSGGRVTERCDLRRDPVGAPSSDHALSPSSYR